VWLGSNMQRSSTIEVSLAATLTASRGVHDSRAEHMCIAPNALLLSAVHAVTLYTQYGRDMNHWQRVGVRAPQTHHQASLDAPLSCCNVHDARLPIHDGAGADVFVLVRGKQLPVVVLMRGGGRRCTWPVDAASGLSTRVLEDTGDGMARAP
jgi:hypothetical protein